MQMLRIAVAAVAVAVATMTVSAADPLASLAGSEWGFPDAGDAYVQFKEKDVSGFAGCNRFRATYTFDGGALTLGPLATTRMACPPEKMEIERKVLQILQAAKSAESSHKSLILKDATGAGLATLQRRDWD
ncbi:MAG: META domain-containing protein [Deltaproteobacteria bacterium]